MRITDDLEIELTGAELRALLGHASTDTTRMHLTQVHFEVSAIGGAGPVLSCVTTDGHRLAKVSIPAPTMSEQSWSVQICEIPKVGLRETIKFARCGRDGAGINITTASGPKTVPASQVQFPPWRQIMPAELSAADSGSFAAIFGVNPHYLADLALVAKAVNKECKSVRVQTPTDDLAPILFKFDHPTEPTLWHVVIMPTRL